MRISDWSSDVCSSDLLDAINPQLAARMTQPLVRWRKFDAGRGRAMTDALRRIVDRPTLSKDVYEIASTALDRTSVVWGKSVSVRVDLGGRRIIKKKNIKNYVI